MKTRQAPLVSAKRKAIKPAAIKRTINPALNPCSGRTQPERAYIQRRLDTISDELIYHLSITQPEQPQWLPEAVITPTQEAIYVESREKWESAIRDEYGFIEGQSWGNQRASNRVRVASWYRNEDTQELYMIALLMISPLRCDEWGALPLTKAHWCIVIDAMTATHLHWKWIHAVRKYWSDDAYQVGGTFGWYMEPCKKLIQDNSPLWTGQAIYHHAVRQYSDHVSGT